MREPSLNLSPSPGNQVKSTACDMSRARRRRQPAVLGPCRGRDANAATNGVGLVGSEQWIRLQLSFENAAKIPLGCAAHDAHAQAQFVPLPDLPANDASSCDGGGIRTWSSHR